MCGIVGYIGNKPCVSWVYQNLQKLEYRGYDSSGIAVLDPGGQIHLVKAEGKLAKLFPLLDRISQEATIGMGHTRWATHGAPSEINAHPHKFGGVALIHNGILDNYKELKDELMAKGVEFTSQTDTEVILQLLYQNIEAVKDLKQAILVTLKRLKGAYSLGILTTKSTDEMYVVKQGSPLVVGIGEVANFFASDPLALLDHTNEFIFLEDGEIARLTPRSVEVWDFEGQTVTRDTQKLVWQGESISREGYKHFMLKEIFEQPKVLSRLASRLIDFKTKEIRSTNLGLDAIPLKDVGSIQIVACGTAFLAGMIGKIYLEQIAKLPVQVELASEFRYRDPYMAKDTLLIAVTQSGETADTVASVKYAKQKGNKILSICNVMYSSIPREAHGTLYMDAGPEVGVASTKAFTSMVLSFVVFGLKLALERNTITREHYESAIVEIEQLEEKARQALLEQDHIREVASHFSTHSNAIFMGRGFNFPIALEGALKLKEISYIHAEGYAGGELKHGPIALIDSAMPVVAITPQDDQREKMLSNIEEVRARHGQIYGVGSAEDHRFKSLCEYFISVPQTKTPVIQSILTVIPLQLLAYHTAVHRGTDVDQPRNLAKSVTVE